MSTPIEQKKNPFRDILQKIQAFYDNIPIPQKRKRLILIGASAFLLIAIALSILILNGNKGDGYRVLYSGLDMVEAIEVHDAVREFGVTPQIDRRGQILVPEAQYDYLLLQLAAKGHPRSTLAYDVFLDNTGMTSTESDKKQIMIFQLQNRIQDTLRRINGVESAVVNLTLPDDSGSVWVMASADRHPATAGVILTLKRDVELYPEQIAAIKNLIAASVPKMEPENVKVVNSATGMELEGLDSTITTIGGSWQALQLEQSFQDLIESNVRRILLPWYGEKGVFVVARVTLDLDRMMQERYELLPRVDSDGEDGGGFPTHHEVEGYLGGVTNAGGIVGEENNTDIPTYPLQGDYNDEDHLHYFGEADYDYGYLKTQVDSGRARIKRGTVSVLVDEKNMTVDRRLEIIDIVSKSVDIAPEFIALSALNLPEPLAPIIVQECPPTFWEKLPFWAYIAIGAGVMLIFVLLITIYVRQRRKIKQARLEAQEAREREEALMRQMEALKAEQEAMRAEAEEAAAAAAALAAVEAPEKGRWEEPINEYAYEPTPAALSDETEPEQEEDEEEDGEGVEDEEEDEDEWEEGDEGEEEDDEKASLDAEFERYKKELADAAKAETNTISNAITNEVRQFAQDNPEITANLLRNWLKEGEE